jgi:hypothetical protein
MRTFESFYSDLISDEQWFEFASKNHKLETFKLCAERVYAVLLSDPVMMDVTPMKEHRNHVFNKLAKILPDKPKAKAWHEVEREKIEKKEAEEKEKEWKPVSWEKRADYLNQLQEIIKGSSTINAVPRLTNKEIIESGQVRLPKSNGDYHRSVVEQMVIAKESKERIRECRRKFFLDAFSDATEEEIHAYWQKFEDSKD